MIIGIDFDNTIADYTKLFTYLAVKQKYINKNSKISNKYLVKSRILNLNNGEKKWMKLQGVAYGKYMHKAQVMNGFFNFLYLCKSRSYKIYIVSHKTKYGHYDKTKTLLRKSALEWIKTNDFLNKSFSNISKKNIFFYSSQSKKIKKIKDLRCHIFIDDLESIFDNTNFPIKTKKILINPSKIYYNNLYFKGNWDEITKKIFGKLKKKDIKLYLSRLNLNNIKNIKKIKGSGNSQLYKIRADKDKNYALKVYPSKYFDQRERLRKEFYSFNYLRKNNFTNIPSAIFKSEELNIGLYEWIEGEKILKPKIEHIQKLIYFIKDLKKISKKTNYDIFEKATESCLKSRDILIQIEKRIYELNKIKNTNKLLKNFLDDIFFLVWAQLKNQYPLIKIDNELAKSNQILSPADLSLDNCLKIKDKIYILDFEYFGWDDPVKLASDFYWHPSMNLSPSLKKEWINSMINIFKDDKFFKKRLIKNINYYGIRWILIILNDFFPHILQKRINAQNINFSDRFKYYKKQLTKANKIVHIIKYNLINDNNFI